MNSSKAVPTSMVQWVAFWTLALAWGSSFLFIKIGVSVVGPFTLVTGRFFIGAILVGLLILFRGESLQFQRGDYLKMAILAFINTALPIFLISWGEQSIDSGLASILNSTVPIWTIILAHLSLHDEPLVARKIAGVLVGFAGVIVLVGFGGSDSGSLIRLGELAVIVAAIFYAIASIFVRRYLSHIPHNPLIFITLTFATLMTAPFMIMVEGIDESLIQPKALMAMSWLGIVGTALAYQIYYRLIAWWGAGRATTVTYTFPVVAVLLGIVFLQESITRELVIGGGLILAGVMLANQKRRRALVP